MLLLVTMLAAGVPEGKGRVVVDFAAVEPSQAWFAGALELTLEREFSRFGKVAIVANVPAETCKGRDTRCLLDAYAPQADVVVLGTVAHGILRYQTYETWTRSLVAEGRLATRGSLANVDELQAKLGHVVRPVVQRGGAIDSRPVATASAAPVDARLPFAAQGILAALIALMLTPAFLLRWLGGGWHARPASRRWCRAIASSFALAAVIVSVPRTSEAIALATRGVARLGVDNVLALLPALAGGALWGVLALIAARLIAPRLHGVERIRHEALAPLLRVWLQVALVRAVLVAAAMVPIFALSALASSALGFSPRASRMVVTPAAGLLAWFWLLALVDHLALHLDHALVEGAAAHNAWHRTIARYFRGYVRRTGLDLDSERFRFLPGNDRVSTLGCYGGGFAPPRVLVSRDAREAALGSLPDEIEMPERTVNYEELPFGILVPEPDAKKAKEGLADQMRREAGAAPARGRVAPPRSVGENATLLGWVMPQAQDSGLPLISDSVEDFEVVRELLTMHYAGFEKNLEEGEYDDTDPTQKDFLYGGLLREVGRCLRGDSLFETLRLVFVLQAEKMSAPTRRISRAIGELYSRFFAGDSARVADAYAVLNGARDHLIQHLFREWDAGEYEFTARAPAPTLYDRSKAIVLGVLARPPRGAEFQLFRDTRRNRLLWLSEYLHASTLPEIDERRARRVRVIAVTTALVLVSLGLATRSAVLYHPTYEARIHDMERRVAEEKAEEEAERKTGAPDGGNTATE